MAAQPPSGSDQEAAAFASAIGKAIQNYGTIEYLVNALIAEFCADDLVASHFTKLTMSKRLDILKSYADRREAQLVGRGFVVGDLFATAKAAFNDRNKIAHNPFVILVRDADGRQVTTYGIHVVRFNDEGRREEWIDRERLHALTVASLAVAGRFRALLECCTTQPG